MGVLFPAKGMEAMKKAFTVVELLAVVGIIAVLVALLLPALSGAREQAKSAGCLSNLRQLAAAAQAYAAGNDGTWPASHLNYRTGNQTITRDWDFSYVNDQPVGAGLLWPGQKEPRVQRCPSWDGRAFTNRDTPYNGYNYNVSYVGGEPQWGLPQDGDYIRCKPSKISSIRDPSHTALFGDAESNAAWSNTYMRAPYPSPSERDALGSACDPGMTYAAANDAAGGAARRSGAQGFRHGGRTNVAYCDGHADSVAAMYHLPDQSNEVGFISVDNSAYGGPP